MLRRLVYVATALVCAAAGVSEARADFVGSVSFAVFGVSLNSNLTTATSFTVGNLLASDATGDFAGLPTGFPGGALYTGGTFDLAGTDFLTLDSGENGMFQQLAAPVLLSYQYLGDLLVKTYYLEGEYVGGVVGSAPLAASLNLTFTQDTVGGGAVGASATLSIPPTHVVPAIPEPASVAMLGISASALSLLALRRRARA